MFGRSSDNGNGQLEIMEKLETCIKDPDGIAMIKSRILRWLGHVSRRGKESLARRSWTGRPEGRKPLSRPRLRWGI